MDDEDVRQLTSLGFWVGQDCAPLEELACRLGAPVRVFASDSIPERLLVPNHLSVQGWLSYGQPLGFLPFHTDCPHFDVPPHYVLLRLVSVGTLSCETVLSDPMMQLRGRSYLTEVPWLRRCPSGRLRSCRLVEKTGFGSILRYDDVSMRPAFDCQRTSRSLLLQACESSIVFRRELAEGETLVFDNWRLMHARRLVTVAEMNRPMVPRVIDRVLVQSLAEGSIGALFDT